jgi:hypothetical protein
VLVGTLRTARAVKAYAPESGVPGWIAGATAPVIAIFLLVVLVLAVQVGGNAFLVIGVVALILRALLHTRHAARMATPVDAAGLPELLAPLQVPQFALGLVAAVCLLVAAFTTRVVGLRLFGFGDDAFASPFQLLDMALDFAGRAFLTTVLLTDGLLAVLRRARRPLGADPTDLDRSLEDRLRQLDAAGVTDLGRAPAPPTAPT